MATYLPFKVFIARLAWTLAQRMLWCFGLLVLCAFMLVGRTRGGRVRRRRAGRLRAAGADDRHEVSVMLWRLIVLFPFLFLAACGMAIIGTASVCIYTGDKAQCPRLEVDGRCVSATLGCP